MHGIASGDERLGDQHVAGCDSGPRAEVVSWVSRYVVPVEADLRRWLRRGLEPDQVDDVVQEVYCRLLTQDITQVRQPKAYVRQMARNIVIDEFRKRKVVDIEPVQCIDEVFVADSGRTPEDVAILRAQIKWVERAISNLPARCRRVFELRKIKGFTQAETAMALSLSENIVEKEVSRGLRAISDCLKKSGSSNEARLDWP